MIIIFNCLSTPYQIIAVFCQASNSFTLVLTAQVFSQNPGKFFFCKFICHFVQFFFLGRGFAEVIIMRFIQSFSFLYKSTYKKLSRIRFIRIIYSDSGKTKTLCKLLLLSKSHLLTPVKRTKTCNGVEYCSVWMTFMQNLFLICPLQIISPASSASRSTSYEHTL